MLRRDIDRTHVPTTPGVYKFLSKGEKILYIGKAKNLKKRLQQYFSPGSVWKQDMVKKARRVEWLPTKTEQEALMLEIQMINNHKPFYNNLIKGTTSYVYIKITRGPYPLLSLTRYRKNDKHIYIGPKLRKRDIKNLLQTLRQLFQRRSCNQATFNKGVVCSDYFFGLCKGRCAYHALEQNGPTETNEKVGFTPVMNTKQAEQEYEEIINVLSKFFKGKHTPLQTHLHHEIQTAVDKENYERAAKLRDMYHIIENITEKQTVVLDRLHSGVFASMTVDDVNIFWVVITLEGGKIVDVITGHEKREDSSTELIKHAIQREYQVDLQQSAYYNHVYFSMEDRLSKKHQTVLHSHATNFIEGYKTSRLKQDSRAYSIHLLKEMQDRFYVHTLPIHIECLDISHFSGEWTVGGLTGMYYGKLQKNMYRRFKIRQAAAHDDYGALKEVLQRRFLSTQASAPPDFFVIDGGKGQLNIIQQLQSGSDEWKRICEMTTFVSLGKGEARTRKGKQKGTLECVYIFHGKGITAIPLIYDDTEKLLISLRDEAHRFANAYRKKLQSKEFE